MCFNLFINSRIRIGLTEWAWSAYRWNRETCVASDHLVLNSFPHVLHDIMCLISECLLQRERIEPLIKCVTEIGDYLLVTEPYLDAICRRFAAIDVNVRLHILHFKLSSGFELFHDAAEKEVQPKKKISFCPWIKLGYKKNQIKPKSNKIIQLNLNQIIKRKENG